MIDMPKPINPWTPQFTRFLYVSQKIYENFSAQKALVFMSFEPGRFSIQETLIGVFFYFLL